MTRVDEDGNTWERYDEECGDYLLLYTRLNGVLHGERNISRLSSGESVLSENYEYGKLHGERIIWEDYGNKIIEMYSNGVLHGPIEEYTYDDVIVMTGNYVNGKKHGIFIYYDDLNGNERVMYHNDEEADESELLCGHYADMTIGA